MFLLYCVSWKVCSDLVLVIFVNYKECKFFQKKLNESIFCFRIEGECVYAMVYLGNENSSFGHTMKAPLINIFNRKQTVYEPNNFIVKINEKTYDSFEGWVCHSIYLRKYLPINIFFTITNTFSLAYDKQQNYLRSTYFSNCYYFSFARFICFKDF